MSAAKENIKSIFGQAMALSSPQERAAYVQQACAGDAALRAEIESLLQADRDAGSFLGEREPCPAATIDDPISERLGTVIGPYKLMEQIGEGGMGLVFVAEQQQPIRRKVALKLIKPGMDTRQVVARFEAERQALALMEHPNIAKVLDGGATAAGRPYFVMELVKGRPITDYCDQNRLSIRERLELFVSVCQAVQHAHQKGIIHRDIKPSNVLLTLHDGTPMVKVIDFGVAKAIGQQLTDKTIYTQFAQMVGTPLYMSPEQAGMSNLDVDTRSDIYSLGVLLYELLTGTTPFDKERLRELSYDEMRRIIREEEPPKPSTRISTLGQAATSICTQRQSEPKRLSQLFRGELDWIVMKALEKDRNRRYETANGLAMDVQRYLSGEAVLAHPPSAVYRLRKFVRRHRSAVWATSLLFVLTIAGIGNAFWWMQQQTKATQKRIAAETEALTAWQEAQRWQRDERWSEALSANRRAQVVLSGFEADAFLKRQIEELGKDLDMAQRLQEARLQGTAVKDEHFDGKSFAPACAKAFARYGLDVEHLDDGTAAEYIRSRSIQKQLIAALDRWARCSRSLGGQQWKHLLAVARAADVDAWRNRLRDAWEHRDVKAVKDLLASADVEKNLPQTTLDVLLQLFPSQNKAVLEERAAALLRRAQQRNPADFWINHDLATLLLHAEPPQREAAIRHYMIAVALRPESPGAHLNLGKALAEKGQLDEAIAEYREAIRLKNDYAMPHNNLGEAIAEKGQVDEAIVEFREAIRLNKDWGKGHSNLGGALVMKGQLDEAIAECREAIRLDKDLTFAHLNLGAALRTKGQLDEAIAECREAIRLDKDCASAHCNLGSALYSKGQLDKAIAEFREAIRLKKDLAEAHYNLGNALYSKGQLDKAIAEFREAIRINKDCAEAHCNLGYTLLGKGQLDEAVAECREAIRLKKDDAVAHYNLGTALRMKGQLDEAIAEYREAIRLKKDFAYVHCDLGGTLEMKGQLDEAIAEYREAIRIKKDDPFAHINLGNALRDKGRLDEAIAEYREAIRLKKNFAPAHVSLRDALAARDLLAKLPAILSGKAKADDVAQQLALARVCQAPYKRLYAAAARFYGDAFSAKPRLADDLNAQHRYNAACAAALAGCGQGADADKLDAKERARLRRQGLDWLRADLNAYRQLLEKSAAKAGPAIVQQMHHWFEDEDFAAVRGDKALAKLPEDERPAWRKLWKDAADMLTQAQGKAASHKK